MTYKLIYNENSRLVPWAEEKVGVGNFRNDAQAIGLERDGDLIAVVVFDTFSSSDCYIHIASDGSKRWLTRDLLIATFAYVFVQLRLRRVTGVVASRNKEALAFDQNLGFKIEGYCREAMPDDDAYILGMLRKECRFITEEHRNG